LNTVQLQLESDELSVLRDLLRYESIYQMKAKIDVVPDKVELLLALIKLFDAYRVVDDQLRIFEFKNKKSTNHTYTVDRGVCGLYASLCTKTVQMELPEDLLVRAEYLGPGLMMKFEDALSDSPKQPEGDLKINYFSPKGQA